MNRVLAWSRVILVGCLLAPGSAAYAAEPTYSASGLYNQGNAYARAGKPGMAVLNYERAALLAPGDLDIQANIAAVRESLQLPALKRDGFESVVLQPAPSSAALVGLLGLLLLGVSLLSGMVRALSRGLRNLTAAIGAALLAFTVCQGLLLWPAMRAAVVIARDVPVLESPVPMAEPLFHLPEAQIVTVSAEHDHFMLIKTSDDRTGWVADTNVAPVVPSRPIPQPTALTFKGRLSIH